MGTQIHDGGPHAWLTLTVFENSSRIKAVKAVLHRKSEQPQSTSEAASLSPPLAFTQTGRF